MCEIAYRCEAADLGASRHAWEGCERRHTNGDERVPPISPLTGGRYVWSRHKSRNPQPSKGVPVVREVLDGNANRLAKPCRKLAESTAAPHLGKPENGYYELGR